MRKLSLPTGPLHSWKRFNGAGKSLWQPPMHSEKAVKKGIVVAGKYTPLETYLRDLPAEKSEVTLSFEEIERIIGANLPSSAYEYQQWWDHEKEGNHVNARAWTNAGWRVEHVDFDRRQARLVRI
jgi:hypothetical protein